jgi:hypothetical protein
MRLTALLISDVEAVGKVSKQILGRDAEKSDPLDCATIYDLMLGEGQTPAENIVLTRQRTFSTGSLGRKESEDRCGIS